MEDSHVANAKFMGDEQKSLFGVFDGHGGREVAVFCQNHYEDILEKDKKMIDSGEHKEWLRKSFLNVDDELREEKGQNELGDLRRQKPPKKPAILNILGEATGKQKQQQEEQQNSEMMLDSIGCTSNVIYIEHDKKKMWVANAGDSRCTMGRDRKAKELSFDHKPEN